MWGETPYQHFGLQLNWRLQQPPNNYLRFMAVTAPCYYVPYLQGSVIRDSVDNYVVDGRADALGKLHVLQGRRVGAIGNNLRVHGSVDCFGGETWTSLLDKPLREHQHVRSEATGAPDSCQLL